MANRRYATVGFAFGHGLELGGCDEFDWNALGLGGPGDLRDMRRPAPLFQ